MTTIYPWGKSVICFMAFLYISVTFHMLASRDIKSLIFRKKIPIKISDVFEKFVLLKLGDGDLMIIIKRPSENDLCAAM